MTSILVGAISHESNSFSPLLTEREDFRFRFGKELLDTPCSCDTLDGILSTLAAAGVEAVPALYARAEPGGLVANAVFEELRQSLAASVTTTVAGACFYLHGAMRAVGEDYCDLEFLRVLRQRLGPDRPIAIAFDMHANLVPEVAELADIVVAFRTAPHIDEAETGALAAELLLRTLRREISPVSAVAVTPWLLPGEQAETKTAPLSTIMRDLTAAAGQSELLAASFTNGHPWTDIANINVAVTVVAQRDRAHARAEANRLLQRVWQQRSAFRFAGEALPPVEAVTVSLQTEHGPVFISDSGDNPDAGGTTTEVGLLRELLRVNAPSVLFFSLLAPSAWRLCLQAGLGANIAVTIEDYGSGEHLSLNGTVKRLGRFAGPVAGNENCCNAAMLRCEGVDIIFTEQRASLLDPAQLHSLQLDAATYHIVAIKRDYLTPELNAVSRRTILAPTTGATDCVLERLPYQRLVRPVWPLDRTVAI